MKLKITTIQDHWNPAKSMQYKISTCKHFYCRQLINNKPIYAWKRCTKDVYDFTIDAYAVKA